MAECRRGLSVVDRTLIEVRLRDGWGIRAIARSLDRSPGMVSDEVARHGGRAGYAAQAAQTQAGVARSRCGRRPRLAAGSALFAEVAALLRQGRPAEQIAGRRMRIEDAVEQQASVAVSHETIYAALYALPRGELRRELIACLRQGKPRRGRTPKGSERRGRLCDMTPIAQRPDDVAARLVPGHWEGDLILGQDNSAIGTLVERTTRFLLLVLMPSHKAAATANAFASALIAIPKPLRRTLTYDQGKEMARHKDLAQATGLRVFFADPHSPWQRGTNENTNGLLRQYFPKGMSLASLTQADLDTVAHSLNTRPRKTLGFDTPDERFTHLLANPPATHTPDTGVRSEN